MTESNVRGAGRPRGGATDTTMLIWKVIEASPGITRAGIWERVEHDIPAGYAQRVYGKDRQRKGKSIPSGAAIDLRRARGYVLTLALINLRACRSVSWQGEGQHRCYSTNRKPAYRGNPELIDVTGTKAAEHMAIADALRMWDKLKLSPSLPSRLGARQIAAINAMANALRAPRP